MPGQESVNGSLTPKRGGRDARSAPDGGVTWRRPDPRKQTIEHQGRFLGGMLARFVALCRAEPEQGLPVLLRWQRVLDSAVREIGTTLTELEGPQTVAEELTRETGEPWSRQRVDNRWGRP